MLILGGADVNATDPDGWTPLHATVGFGQLDVATVLVEAGANVHAGASFSAPPEHLPAGKDPSRWTRNRERDRRTSGVTPLHLTGFYISGLHSRPFEFARLLLDAGANPNVRTKHGSTPLDFARTQVEFNHNWAATVPAAWSVSEYREQWARADERFPLFQRLMTGARGVADT